MISEPGHSKVIRADPLLSSALGSDKFGSPELLLKKSGPRLEVLKKDLQDCKSNLCDFIENSKEYAEKLAAFNEDPDLFTSNVYELKEGIAEESKQKLKILERGEELIKSSSLLDMAKGLLMVGSVNSSLNQGRIYHPSSYLTSLGFRLCQEEHVSAAFSEFSTECQHELAEDILTLYSLGVSDISMPPNLCEYYDVKTGAKTLAQMAGVILLNQSRCLDQSPFEFIKSLYSEYRAKDQKLIIKADLVSHIGREVRIPLNDQKLVVQSAMHQGNSPDSNNYSKAVSLAQEHNGDLSIFTSFMTEYLEERVRMLQDHGEVYVKNSTGAVASFVVNTRLKNKSLFLNVDDQQILNYLELQNSQLISFQAIKELAENTNELSVEIRECGYDEFTYLLNKADNSFSGNSRRVIKEDGKYYDLTFRISHNNSTYVLNPALLGSDKGLNEEQLKELVEILKQKNQFFGVGSENSIIGNKELGDRVFNCHQSFAPGLLDHYLSDIEVIRHSDTEMELKLDDDEQLLSALAALEVGFIQHKVRSYAEEALDAPKFIDPELYVSRNWETRLTARAKDNGMKAVEEAVYCKLGGEGNAVNNISSAGNEAKELEVVVSNVYQQLYPDESAEFIQNLVEKYKTELIKAAEDAANSAVEHFREKARLTITHLGEDLSNFLLDQVSTDFMAKLDFSSGQPLLTPVLMDINIYPGSFGLMQIDCKEIKNYQFDQTELALIAKKFDNIDEGARTVKKAALSLVGADPESGYLDKDAFASIEGLEIIDQHPAFSQFTSRYLHLQDALSPMSVRDFLKL